MIFVNVAVLFNNASGEAEIQKYRVQCTKNQYDFGDHYDAAIEAANESLGKIDVKCAFDEQEPAGKSLRLAEANDTEIIDC